MDVQIGNWLTNIILPIIIVSLVLWIVGRSIVGKEKAKFTDALWITILAIVIGYAINYFVPLVGFIGYVVSFILWLFLIRRFFDTGWLRALGIAIVAVILMVLVTFVLATFFGLSISAEFFGFSISVLPKI